jgi:hypothetical protein
MKYVRVDLKCMDTGSLNKRTKGSENNGQREQGTETFNGTGTDTAVEGKMNRLDQA